MELEEKPNKGEYEYLFSERIQAALVILAGVVLAAAIAVVLYFFLTSRFQNRYLSLVVAALWVISAVAVMRVAVFAHKAAFVNLCILELAAAVIDLFFIHAWFIAAFSVITPIVVIIVIRSYWIMMDWYTKPQQ